MTKEFYQILEINENATAEEIKKAYRKLALKWHPDKWSTKSPEERAKANEEMQKVNKAYEVLGDEEKKRRYDSGETSFFTASDSESYEEYVRRMNEQYKAEREDVEEKLKILKRIAKILFRSEIEGIISREALLNEVWERHFNDMDSNLWAPYSNWVEKVRNIEIGDDENDREGIDKRELNEFKKNMIKAIREKGAQLKAEKIAKANSDLEKAKLKAIETIEQELEDRELKIEDLEEEYHNYKEEINSLSKKLKIRSYEDKVMEAIRQKSQSGRFEAKQGDFSRQEHPGQLGKEEELRKVDLSLTDEQKINKKMELMKSEKLQDGKLKKTDDVGGDEESREKLKILLDEIKKKENKGQNSQQDKNEIMDPRTIKKVTLVEGENLLVEFEKDGKLKTQFITSEEIVKNQELQKIKESLLEEKKSISQQKNTVTYSDKNNEEKKPTLLIVGGIFIVASVLVIGYWLGKKAKPNPLN